jgi:hypothetical protein
VAARPRRDSAPTKPLPPLPPVAPYEIPPEESTTYYDTTYIDSFPIYNQTDSSGSHYTDTEYSEDYPSMQDSTDSLETTNYNEDPTTLDPQENSKEDSQSSTEIPPPPPAPPAEAIDDKEARQAYQRQRIIEEIIQTEK